MCLVGYGTPVKNYRFISGRAFRPAPNDLRKAPFPLSPEAAVSPQDAKIFEIWTLRNFSNFDSLILKAMAPEGDKRNSFVMNNLQFKTLKSKILAKQAGTGGTPSTKRQT